MERKLRFPLLAALGLSVMFAVALAVAPTVSADEL